MSESLNVTIVAIERTTFSVIYSNAILIANISPVYIDILLVSGLLTSTFNSGIQKAVETLPYGV